MRQVSVRLPEGRGREAAGIATDLDGVNLSVVDVRDARGKPHDLLTVTLSNRRVEPFLDRVERLGEARITFSPNGVLALYPPESEAADQVSDVQLRSPIEIFLAGLQSIGSWKGFLSYATAAGLIVWIGLFTNTMYLLTAAMLVAPFAGPAMNLAIGTARGDTVLIRRSVLRYFVGLAVTIAAAAVMSLILGHEIATPMMIDRSQISSVAVLLPIVAGAAGAMNLLQSERSSLVSGAAVGMLVAASLAPPAGVVGMAIAIGEWEMAQSGTFLLFLQLAGINLAGAAVFRMAGLRTRGPRFERGSSWVSVVTAVLSVGALAGLLALQFHSRPNLVRSTEAQRAAASIHQAIERSGVARLVEANVRFTRADLKGENALLCVLYVEPSEVGLSDAEVGERVRKAVFDAVRTPNVTPLVAVTVVEGRETQD